MEDQWKSRLRKALNPEIKRLVKLIDAYTRRYVQFGDSDDLRQADQLRKRVTALKEEIRRSEEGRGLGRATADD